jgi:glycosyltransferase involved in cell wall biosynthesis
VTGWTVDTHAPEQVAQRIGQLMEEKEERQKMGFAAHELALSQFSWEHTVNEMEALYASVSR